MLDIEELRCELPKIGDVLVKKPSEFENDHLCIVTYINEENLWYQVEFDLIGGKFKQSYSLMDDYNQEMKKYWGAYSPSLLDQSRIRIGNIEKFNKRYRGKLSVPNVVLELEKYNKKHKTQLSYGQYVNLCERKENKNG